MHTIWSRHRRTTAAIAVAAGLMTVAALASTRTLVLAAYLLVLCGISVVADRRRRPAPTTRTRTFSTGSR